MPKPASKPVPIKSGARAKPLAAKARAVRKRRPEHAPVALGWDTSDQHEIEVRRWRGRTELSALVALEPEHGLFGTVETASATGGSRYRVEIRNLAGPDNSCSCIDYRINGLGTCKHIEGVLHALRRRGARAFAAGVRAGSPRVEVCLDRRGAVPVPALQLPRLEDPELVDALTWLRPYCDEAGRLSSEPDMIAASRAARGTAPDAVRARVRVSADLQVWLDRQRRARQRIVDRQAFETELAAGRASLDILKHQLLPYQQAGVLHLVFNKRALLADDMGLGKTIQAIGATELAARLKGVERVLVVCPASLKGEWEEQIARFSNRSSSIVFGPRAQRLEAYRTPAFYTIANYEQVVADAADINALLKPDVVILGEAQRNKNWQIKTARQVKSLRSTFAFVLTGTPIENRIDELYSLVGFVDPEVLGPLFRFNRDYYDLDEKGRAIGYKNLGDLRARVGPSLLRRRKGDVETELPGRTVKTFFVPMADEQKLRYDDYAQSAAAIAARGRNRPLTKQEFERLQKELACMRMLCDTPAILDPTCRISPKLDEFERIVTDLLQDPGRKIIVFSEWERMLAMVKELAGDMRVECAWRTGSVPQERRRAEIARFKRDPDCRLFLSTDSGSVGLNLQVASAVINMDLPWNPAKLEQRIARAWRKNQLQSVTVINLVTENSIEHNMLHLIGSKQALADGVIDGIGDLSAMTLPSGRGAFLSRMEAVLKADSRPPRPAIVSAEERFAADLVDRHGDKVVAVEARSTADGPMQILAVLDVGPEVLTAEISRSADHGPLSVTVIDRSAWSTMQSLLAAGVLRQGAPPRLLHGSEPEKQAARPQLDARTLQFAANARRGIAMARLLVAGGFPEEVPAILTRTLSKGDEDAAAEIQRLVELRLWPSEALRHADALNTDADALDLGAAETLLDALERLLAHLAEPDRSFRLAA